MKEALTRLVVTSQKGKFEKVKAKNYKRSLKQRIPKKLDCKSKFSL